MGEPTGMPMPGRPAVVRSNIIVLDIRELLSQAGFNCRDPEVTRKPVQPDFPRMGEIISRFSLGRQGKMRNFFPKSSFRLHFEKSFS
jgi:hypothetical protein